MCTAAAYKGKDFYFGRTLDYEFSYGDEVVITPRSYGFCFRRAGLLQNHYAMIGMAHVVENYPLYYDAVNEKGLGMAGLNFVGNAFYPKSVDGGRQVAVFEFIPYLLGQCASVSEVKELLADMHIVDIPFNEKLPSAQLHWLIADAGEAITVEATESGLHVYENPVGVLTNNPPFREQMFSLNNYMGLSAKQPQNCFCPHLPLQPYSRGMGAIGLPGDVSSQSRFVRVSFVKMNSVAGNTEEENVSQFFHILGSVDQVRGCCELQDGVYEVTLYTSCCNADRGIYYYTSYDNHQITGVDMQKENLDSSGLIRYQRQEKEQIRMQN